MMTSKSLRVKTKIPMINGIFTHMHYEYPSILTITPQQLDIMFISNWGMRNVAPIVLNIQEDYTVSQLTDSELDELAAMILAYFKYKWDRLGDLLAIKYDPIHNYSDEYHEELSQKNAGESTLTHNTTVADDITVATDRTLTDSGEERRVDSGTKNDKDGGSEGHTTTSSGKEDITISGGDSKSEVVDGTVLRTDDTHQVTEGADEHQLYGFNSELPVPADANSDTKTVTNDGTVKTDDDTTTTTTGTHEETRGNITSGSTSETITGGLTHETSSSNESTLYGGLIHTTDEDQVTQGTKRKTGTEDTESNSELSRVRDSTHLGNIGNLTTQQLMNQEIELWRWNFIHQILDDVKDFLTIPVYD